jgi:hypothetical protein
MSSDNSSASLSKQQVEFEPARTYGLESDRWRRMDGRGCCRGTGTSRARGAVDGCAAGRSGEGDRARMSCVRDVPISSTDDTSNDAEEWMGRCPAHPMPPARGVRPLSSAMGVGVPESVCIWAIRMLFFPLEGMSSSDGGSPKQQHLRGAPLVFATVGDMQRSAAATSQ